MEIYTDIASLRKRLSNETEIAFIPTMGNLHEGHLSLIKTARQQKNCVVVSIFVNRLQFLPNEDFDQYPQSLATDCLSLKKSNVDVLFAPNENIIFPVKQKVTITLPGIANTMEGEFRPGFFSGVATVVLKLFNIIQPQVAYFGKKDYQQFYILRQMVRQLNLAIKMIACEIIRSRDGLALSSRNRYLDKFERRKAPYLHQVLADVKQSAEQGNKDFKKLQNSATRLLTKQGWKVDYITLKQLHTLTQATIGDKNIIVMGAAWLGNTRLIDNLEIRVDCKISG